MSISVKYKEWFAKYDDVEKCKLIKDKAMKVNNNHKKMVNATRREMEYGFNRVGVRGGKFTSLVANSQNATQTYLRTVEELKYMVATL
jgi:hypothetical protein